MTRRHAWIALFALALSLAFLGMRGIWDPDEGRYTNVALNMLDSGDWLEPRRNEDVGHWTKPPLTYWAIASSVAVFGHNPWAARLPSALAYLLCVFLAGRIARRLAPGSEDAAALAFATMLLPFGASQLITTDFVLTACETLAMWGFVEARFGPPRSGARWMLLMWVGLALAFLAKGPPALLPLPVMLAYDRLVPHASGHRVFGWAGVLSFALLALPWFVAVILDNPGLFHYFIGDEVVNRVTTDEFGRHGQWYGWLAVYAPTLVIGTLPWTPTLWRWLRALPSKVRAWRTRDARLAERAWLLPALWIALPLLVFCLSRSRMPLYILPLFVPLAVVVAMQRQREGRALPRAPWLLGWGALLLGLALASAYWPTHKDARAWAQVLRERTGGAVHEVVFVEDMARYGLHLHLGTEIEKISLAPLPPRTGYAAPDYDEDLRTELAESAGEPDAVWITKRALWPAVDARIRAYGHRTEVLGGDYRDRVIFRVRALNAPGAALRPATGG